MSAYRILIIAILVVLSVLFFYGLNTALNLFSVFHDVISFSITLLLIIIFQERLGMLLEKVIAKKYFRRITKAEETLIFLNSELNRAIRYREVNRILFKSFEQLFPNISFAFYILENNKFILQQAQGLNDNELLVQDINAEDIPENESGKFYFNIKDTNLPKQLKRKMLNENLTELIPFQGRVQLFAFLLIKYKSIPFRRENKSVQLFRKIQNKAGIILENTGLFVDLEQKNMETKNLLKISNQILSSLDIKTTLDFILKALKSVTPYDAAAIYLLDKSGKRLLRTSSEGYDPDLINKLHLKVGQGSCGWVVETKEIAVESDVRNSKHYFNLRPETRSQVSIPLIQENEVIGVLCLESNRLSYFNSSVIENLKLFAQLAAIAIYNASQIEIMIKKKALESDLINAGIVQKKLLVQRFPSHKKLKINAINLPSKFMSGDLYDIIRLDDDITAIAIGDVAGKGAPASLMMSLLLAGLRTQKQSYLTACDVVYRLNNLVADTTIEGQYATFFYAIFSLQQNKLIYTNAGHNPPIYIKANGEIVRLTNGGIVLGYIPDWEYQQQTINWESGDILVAYTDGVTEAMNKSDEEFGEQRLIDVILANSKQNVYELRKSIISAIEEFSGTDSPDDDITLVVCKNE